MQGFILDAANELVHMLAHVSDLEGQLYGELNRMLSRALMSRARLKSAMASPRWKGLFKG